MWVAVGPRPEQFVVMAGAVTKYLGLDEANNEQEPVGIVTFLFHIYISS